MDRNINLLELPISDCETPIKARLDSLPTEVDFKASSKSLDSTNLDYEHLLTNPAHLRRIAQIARKQTQGSTVDWQDALQAAQVKLIISMRAGKFSYGTAADFDRWASTVAKFEIIDMVRKSKCRQWDSLDRPLANNLTLLETIADPLDSFTVLETADLVLRIKAIVIDLDKLYPDRSYYQLWLGKIHQRTQAEIAQGLGLTQSAISKRWQELLQRLAVELGLEAASSQDRTRSTQQW